MTTDLTTAAGVIAALVSVVGLLWRDHQRNDRLLETDRDYWRSLALQGTELADKATTAAVRNHRSRDV